MRRKIIAIFFLHTMMLIAAHPVVAMHFCGGRLHSFNFFLSEENHSCCQVIEEPVVEENLICCESEEPLALPEADVCFPVVEQAEDSCCEFQIVELSTDDYPVQVQKTTFNQVWHSFENHWFTLNSLFALNEPEPDASVPENNFPPGGLFMQDVSLLTYICVYRL